jgi:hypothetical protein
MNSSLLIGNSKVDITPTRSIPLAGFKNRTAPFIDVAHRLYAKVIWFRSETESSPSGDAVLISADLIWWSSDLTERLLARIEKQFGVPSSHIILHATHNHGGPQTSKLFLSSLVIADEQYLLQLENSIIDGVDTAVHLLEPVRIRRGSADCRIGIHRRRSEVEKCTWLQTRMDPWIPRWSQYPSLASMGWSRQSWYTMLAIRQLLLKIV